MCTLSIESGAEPERCLKMSSEVNLSIVLPCWKRPTGTRKILSDIVNQTVTGWELNLVGDGCDDFQKLIEEQDFHELCAYQKSLGNMINYQNLEMNGGGSGYSAINKAVEIATRRYTIFVANDDRVSPLHLHNYYTGIVNTDFDMVLFETIVKGKTIREPELKHSRVGHSEIIVRTDALKKAAKHDKTYGHDWKVIVSLIQNGAKVGRDTRNMRTYYVQRLRGDPDVE
jgi:glycosyltransferase involved in cell wall biosynthesis